MNTTLTNDQITAGAAVMAWTPVTKPGQVRVGDKLRFTIGDKHYSQRAKLILHAGKEDEEVIYDKGRNFYFITKCVLSGFSNHKNVEVLQPVAPSPQIAEKVELPPLPEMLGAADMGAVLDTPEDWDADYRATWRNLQIAECNKRQWRAYALQLRDAIAASRRAAGGMVRNGKQEGIERTAACAAMWVEAEAVPLVPIWSPVAARELDVEAERREFEAECKDDYENMGGEYAGPGKDGWYYWSDETAAAWDGWLKRAARSAAQSTAPAPAKELTPFQMWDAAVAENGAIEERGAQVLVIETPGALADVFKAILAAQGTQAESAPVEADPPLRNEWHRRNRPWTDYLEGTKARESWAGGGFWQKTSRGWRWHLGGTFPTPGAADEVLLPSDSPNSPVGGKD
ncbi:hypothetical protein [Massilia haematophila]|uniref:Uncharacterized protein n=1 Tax=Massilia haematophila TaxID=457923 RepID=A0ABV7PGS3_9BURK